MTDELTWEPAWRLGELMRTRQVSPVEVLEHFLGRIEEHRALLRAVEHINHERARKEAKAAEAALLAGEDVGPLHGVPTAVKSHLDIAGEPESMPFGTGVATADDLVVERLRGAGAIVVGHTGMPVWVADGSLDYRATARNPWDPGRTPGISSAGTASAVAGGLLPVAIASDGGGSSRVPAAYSGVIGVHSTPGLVPWVNGKRQTPMGATSTIGPMARDARDAAAVLAVIAGPDGRDEVGLHVELPDPRGEIGLGAEGLRLAWTDDFGFARAYAVEESERVISRIREAAFGLARLGATVEPTELAWEDSVVGLRQKFASEGIASMGMQGTGAARDDPWQTANGIRRRNWQRFRTLFGTYDALLCPTVSSVAPTVDVFAERIPSGMAIAELTPGAAAYTAYCGMLNWLKIPAVSLPCGFVDDLPVGLQIIGPAGSDAKLLRLAHAFTQAFPQDARPPIG